MKKSVLVLLAFAALFVSCAKEKVIDGVTYQPYGFLNEDTMKSDSITYKTSKDDIILAVIFSETIIVPVIVLGNYMYEPVEKKQYPAKIQK